jgi:hypothetical protein
MASNYTPREIEKYFAYLKGGMYCTPKTSIAHLEYLKKVNSSG